MYIETIDVNQVIILDYIQIVYICIAFQQTYIKMKGIECY